MRHYTTVLSIAGSDPSGGAGIQADIKTISALGCYAAAAITALTVQDTTGVKAVWPVADECLEGQIRSLLSDLRPAAVKTGMLPGKRSVQVVARVLDEYKSRIAHIVADPVMVSTSGMPLMPADAIEAYKEELLPLATMLTPNLPEAEALAGIALGSSPAEEQLQQAASAISGGTHCHILIKGGHIADGKMIDRLYAPGGTLLCRYTAPAVASPNLHGTGCALSSAIAAYLALGCSVQEAAGRAKQWLTRAIESGADVEVGRGSGPPDYFFRPEPSVKR